MIISNSIGIPFSRRSAGAGFVGLLDEVPGAVFAASVRLLRADYSGGLARVIAYDGATQFGAADIMPYKIGDNYWIDLNSTLENLDATAIARGLTTSDTLADLCSAGVNNYDGLTNTLCDQTTGTAVNATQASLASMPELVNSGALITENGKPALGFNGNQYLQSNQDISLKTLNSLFSLLFSESSNSTATVFDSKTSNSFFLQIRDGINNRLRIDNSNYDERNLIPLFTNGIISLDFSGGNIVIFRNSASVFSNNISSSITDGITLGRHRTLGLNYFTGNMQELLYYDSNQTTNRGTLETNINNAFSIY